MREIGVLVERIENDLRQFTKPERSEKVKAERPTALEILGTTVPEMRSVANRAAKDVKSWAGVDVIMLGKALVNTDVMECAHAAYEIVAGHKAAMDEITLDDLLEIGRPLDNWVLVDTFAVKLSGVLWREGRINDETILGWTHSDDFWWRRTAVVSTIALNQKSQGGKGDLDRTMLICREVVRDPEIMVQKALSWALREYVKRDPKPIIGFLEEYDAALSSLVRREVWRKVRTGKK